MYVYIYIYIYIYIYSVDDIFKCSKYVRYPEYYMILQWHLVICRF